ncbi:alpha/beta hydrolase-fold protein [Spirosoma flavus]
MKYLLLLCLILITRVTFAQTPSFSVTFPASQSAKPLDGRLLLILAKGNKSEPRQQVSDAVETAQIFGIDVNGLKPGQAAVVDASVFGYPKKSLKELPAGDYYVQAVLHKYETFNRKDGHVVKLPMDRGEGQNWRTAPGNLFSKPQKISLKAGNKQPVALVMDQVNPPIAEPKDTKFIKHIKIQSKRLTEFWGRPMYLGAHVLLPAGFDEHPEARYPLCIYHGHFPDDFGGFSETPQPANMDTTDYVERFHIHGYKKIEAQEAYDFYKKWTSKDFPRMMIIEIQHANPYYDDSYAVNSENLGPYGDAIMYELLPEIEKRFRGIGQGWARFTYGGSTGGWEALAVQTLYPDKFNGCFAACPDPITFDAYTNFNLYKDKNAYYSEGPFRRTPRPAQRNYLGQLKCTTEETNHRELVLGTHSRSGDQFDIWEAVYSPVGSDGYPKRIWNKLTGEIDPTVATYWREHFDLMHILRRDWKTLGPKLTGKIHIYCGDMDNYYLNNAVYLMEDFLKSVKSPAANSEVAYGDRAEHCWNGDPTQPNYISRLRYNTMYIDKILKRIEANHPADADLKSWRY